MCITNKWPLPLNIRRYFALWASGILNGKFPLASGSVIVYTSCHDLLYTQPLHFCLCDIAAICPENFCANGGTCNPSLTGATCT